MAKILVKTDVVPRNLYIMAAVANVAAALLDPKEVVITSGAEGCHKVGSRHYTGEALDVRTKNFPTNATKAAFVTAVLARLGPQYQGFIESPGQAAEHAHFEWDPS